MFYTDISGKISMLEMNIGKYGNIFELPKQPSHDITEAICITTNGIVKEDGKAVMGAGIALEANKYFRLDEKLGQYITQYGNRAFNLGVYQRYSLNNLDMPDFFRVFSFPTKYHFRLDSDINLICKSAEQLVEMCNKFGITKCYLPKVGCGLGKLNYESTVKPWLSQILDDRFIICLRD